MHGEVNEHATTKGKSERTVIGIELMLGFPADYGAKSNSNPV